MLLTSSYAVRVAAYFGGLFLVMGTQLPYLPVWLDDRGLDAGGIALVASAPLFVRLVATPAIAFIADRYAIHRRMVIVLTWLGLATLLALHHQASLVAIALLAIVFTLTWSTIMPLIETIATDGVRARGHDYGRMRLWGSITFVVANFVGGAVLSAYGPDGVVWLMVAGAGLTVAAAHALPRRVQAPHPEIQGPEAQAPEAQVPEIQDSEARQESITATPPSRAAKAATLSPAEAFRLAAAPAFVVFLVAGGFAQASHAVFYIFGTLHWQAQGISATFIGVLWAIGVIAEIALFWWSAHAIRAFGATGLILLGGLGGVLRWWLMGFDPPVWALVPLQVLHGLTFGASHLGAIHFIAQAVSQRQAGTAQALYASITAGVAMAAMMLVAGALFPHVAGRSYWAMAASSGLGSLAAWWLWQHWHGEVIGDARASRRSSGKA
ncbi:MAG: MFS transporter [Pseudomonadota bacterium]